MVDPDAPIPIAGTKVKPFLHWIRINMVNGDFNTGDDVVSYMGPGPPDAKPHHYYFLLYEHNQQLPSDVAQRYHGSLCDRSGPFLVSMFNMF